LLVTANGPSLTAMGAVGAWVTGAASGVTAAAFTKAGALVAVLTAAANG
jgi:hypothetical protein